MDKVFVLIYQSVYDSDETLETYIYTDKDAAFKEYERTLDGAKAACENYGNPPIDVSGGLKGPAPEEGQYVMDSVDLSDPKGVNIRTSIYMNGEYDRDHVDITLQEKELNGHLGPIGLTKRKIHDEI